MPRAIGLREELIGNWADNDGLFRVPIAGGQRVFIDAGGRGLTFDTAGAAYYESEHQIVERTEGAGRRPLASIKLGSVGGIAVAGSFSRVSCEHRFFW